MFYSVTHFAGEPSNRIFDRIVWVRRADLRKYDFLEGDRAFLDRFAEPG